MQPKDLLPPSFEIELQKITRLNKKMVALNTVWIISGIILLFNCMWIKLFLVPQQPPVFSSYFKLLITGWIDSVGVYLVFGRLLVSYFLNSKD
jgi:hypothetical protein